MNTPLVSSNRFGPRKAQPLDNLMANARDVTRGLFPQINPDDLPAEARAMIEDHKRIRSIAARLFAGADGEALLEALCDATLRRPVTIIAPGTKAEDQLLYAVQREGQNQAIYMLLRLIAEGRDETPQPREGSQL